MFLRSLVKLNNFNSVQNCAPKFWRRPKKKDFAAFWFYLSPEFCISCRQVGITYRKTEGARHISPSSGSDPRGHRPPPLPKIYAYVHAYNKF